jgi:hypothetical protein
MHFFAHAAPVPACFAAHIESDIQPFSFEESAALAAIVPNANTAITRAKVRFTNNLRGLGNHESHPSCSNASSFGKSNSNYYFTG